MLLTRSLLFFTIFSGPKTMFNNQNASKLMWIGLGLLLFASILLPASWTSFGQGVTPPLDIFSTEIVQLDNLLDNDQTLPAIDEQTLKAHVIFVQTRRLLRAGPMSSEESRLATKILQEWQLQIDSQAHESSRTTLRRARNDALATQFPRLNPDRLAQELDAVDAQLLSSVNKKARDLVD